MFNYINLKLLLNHLGNANCFYIAYSGGLDSHVLLHALATLFREQNKLSQLQAIHINHGWSENAAQWAQHCVKVCKDLGVICNIEKINAKLQRGESKEAMAREQRYQIFAKYLNADDYLLTAHQQDDQAETLLLQLFRGAGIKGLACMPEIIPFATGYHLRPLLNFTRVELQQYAIENNLQWIEDESNQDVNFDRNYVRHNVMPIINQRWSKAQSTIARSAQHLAAANLLLEQLAQQDLINTRGNFSHTLSINKLLELPEVRLHNVLRHWLQQLTLPLPSAAQLNHIQTDVLQTKSDRKSQVKWDKVIVCRYRDDLYARNAITEKKLENIDWNLTQELNLPGVGIFAAELVKGQGIRQNVFSENKAKIQFRKMGERCKPAGRIGSHPLKKLFQEWDVPPWEREDVPLLYNQDDQLVAVLNYCICDSFVADENEVGWLVKFQRSNI